RRWGWEPSQDRRRSAGGGNGTLVPCAARSGSIWRLAPLLAFARLASGAGARDGDEARLDGPLADQARSAVRQPRIWPPFYLPQEGDLAGCDVVVSGDDLQLPRRDEVRQDGRGLPQEASLDASIRPDRGIR